MMDANKLALYKKVFDAAPVAYAILELETDDRKKPKDVIFRYANQAFAGMRKFTVADLLNKSYGRLMHKETTWLPTFAVTATTGRTTHFSLSLPEHLLYLHVDCYQLELGICGCVVTDISVEGNMSQQLLMEHESFEAALNSTGLHHWVYDIKHQRSLQSMSSQRELGVPAVMENYPQSFLDTGMILPKYWNLYLDMHKKIREGAREVTGEYQIWPPAEPFPHWEQLVYKTIFDEKGEPVKAVGTALNVSARKYLEERFQDFLAHHRRVLQSRTDAFRVNISKDTIMPLKDQMGFFKSKGRLTMNHFFELSAQNIQDAVSLRRYKKLFNQESLLEIYKKGIKRADLVCHYDMPGSGKKWLRICMDMTRDPSTSDIIGITYTEDLTETKLNDLALQLMIGRNYEMMLRADYKTGQYVVFVYDGTIQQVTKRGDDVFAYLKLGEHRYLGWDDEDISLAGIWKRLQAKNEFCAYYEIMSGEIRQVKKLQFYTLDAAAGQFCIGCRDVTYEVYGIKE